LDQDLKARHTTQEHEDTEKKQQAQLDAVRTENEQLVVQRDRLLAERDTSQRESFSHNSLAAEVAGKAEQAAQEQLLQAQLAAAHASNEELQARAAAIRTALDEKAEALAKAGALLLDKEEEVAALSEKLEAQQCKDAAESMPSTETLDTQLRAAVVADQALELARKELLRKIEAQDERFALVQPWVAAHTYK